MVNYPLERPQLEGPGRLSRSARRVLHCCRIYRCSSEPARRRGEREGLRAGGSGQGGGGQFSGGYAPLVREILLPALWQGIPPPQRTSGQHPGSFLLRDRWIAAVVATI